MRYRHQQHIRKASDFQLIRTSGLRRECGFFCVNFLLLPDRSPPLRRSGYIVSKRIGNAVARNRAKRWLREAFRLHQENLPPSCDIVLIARKAINEASFAEVSSRLGREINQFAMVTA